MPTQPKVAAPAVVLVRMPKQSECLRLFGNPSSNGWQSKNTVRVPVPWRMSMGDIPIKSIQINKVAADSLARVIAKIWDRCGQTQSAIHAAGCDCFSGSFAVRPIRGSTAPSMHSYALAIDFNAPANPLGAPESKTLFKPSSLVVKAFAEEKWIWGGNWVSRRDAMHFSSPPWTDPALAGNPTGKRELLDVARRQTSFDAKDAGHAHIITFGKFLIAPHGLKDFVKFSFGDATAHSGATVSDPRHAVGVFHVRRSINPLQILDAVIRFVSVFVVDVILAFYSGQKSSSHQAVNEEVLLQNHQLQVAPAVWLRDSIIKRRKPSVRPELSPPAEETNPALVGNLVSVKSIDRKPMFGHVRILSERMHRVLSRWRYAHFPQFATVD